MFRIAFKTFALTGFASLAISSIAVAHPEPANTPEPLSAPSKTTAPQLPTEAEIADILETMPDFNALMGDMLGVVQDEKLQSKMKSTAKNFGEKIEKSGALDKRDANGLPDFNALFAVMLPMIADEDGLGGLIEPMSEIAEKMEGSMQKHAPNNIANP